MSWCEKIKRPQPVLLIDDCPEDVELFRYAARAYHCDVISVPCAEQAIDVLKVRPDIQIILLDLGLPGADGSEAIKGIREIAPEAKIAIYTGRCEKLGTTMQGCPAVIKKPYSSVENPLKELMRIFDVPLACRSPSNPMLPVAV